MKENLILHCLSFCSFKTSDHVTHSLNTYFVVQVWMTIHYGFSFFWGKNLLLLMITSQTLSIWSVMKQAALQRCQKCNSSDFPGSPVVKNLHYNAGGADSTPGQGSKIPYSMELLAFPPYLLSLHSLESMRHSQRRYGLQLLSPHTTIRESVNLNKRSTLQKENPQCHNEDSTQ